MFSRAFDLLISGERLWGIDCRDGLSECREVGQAHLDLLLRDNRCL
jgi:hypothetical protein